MNNKKNFTSVAILLSLSAAERHPRPVRADGKDDPVSAVPAPRAK